LTLKGDFCILINKLLWKAIHKYTKLAVKGTRTGRPG